MKQCPTCKNEVSYNAETCPKCGHILKRKNSNWNDPEVVDTFLIS